jgi:peroxiredoxin Q/BCP
MAKVSVGDPAPNFSLRSQDGEVVELSDLLRRGSVVVYFYPKDRTPGCTAEAGAFRDSYRKFAELGAEVVGISSDSVDSHKGFANECGLPFRILSDAGGKVRRKYGVSSTMGIIPGRVTYVIDKGGIVRYIFSSQLQATRHVREALEAIGETGEALPSAKENAKA